MLTINGVSFSSVKQAYEYFKARLIHDFESGVQVMCTSDMAELEQIGQDIDVPRHRWNCVKGAIMDRLIVEKVRATLYHVFYFLGMR